MTFETCRFIFIAGAAAAGVMLVVTVLLFVLLHIPRVIGDLTGANARKAIEDIERRGTGESGASSLSERLSRQSAAGSTGRTARSGRTKAKTTGRVYKNRRPTASLHPEETTTLDPAGPPFDTGETVPLDASQSSGDETVLLHGNSAAQEGTTLFGPMPGNESETVLLSGQAARLYQTAYGRGDTARAAPPEGGVIQGAGDFEVIEDITYIHTDEVI